MINTSYFYNILRENINTFEEKHELESLDQDALYEAIGVMSKGMLNKIGAKSIDYGDIPDSKGGYFIITTCMLVYKQHHISYAI